MDSREYPGDEPQGHLKTMVENADSVYKDNFNNSAWFGRCIFLSWYCERGTCDFCFRSTQKHKIRHPKSARRRLSSVLAEAALIRGLGWRLEFLTGGYGIYPFKEIVEICRHCKEILGEKLWVNLGVLKAYQLRRLKPYVQGIVSSLETLEPELHDKVCPDKPIEPYLNMMQKAKDMGFLQSFTLVIGLGEKKSYFANIRKFIERYAFDRVTLYALRPVEGTPYKNGPSTEDMLWWVSAIRQAFPKIEIIAGTAIYRLKEIRLLLKAGANGFTKLPATKMFNTEDARAVEEQVRISGRDFVSDLTSRSIWKKADWKKIIHDADIPESLKRDTFKKLEDYLGKMSKKR